MPEHDETDNHFSADDVQLTRLGKRPILKRTFGFWALLGFSCTILVTWEGILLTFETAYTEGGPAGTVYTYILVWLGMISTYTCLCELVSMAPTAGGQYHWVAMLAPPSCSQFLSYITGWLTLTGWQAGCASGAFNSGLLIQGLIQLCNTDYVPQKWQTPLLGWAVLLFAVFINVAATTLLANFERLVLFLHIAGFFAVLIPLATLAPHVGAHDVFDVWLDGGNWHDRGYSFLIGLVGPVYAFVGSDSAVHMSEEVQNAAVVIPRSILISIGLNGSFGFGMLIVLLFSIGPPAVAIQQILETKLGFPFVQLFLDATKSISGSAVMASIVLVLGISSTVGLLAAASRMFWSFARDRALPLWQHISHVDRRTSLPVNATLICATISALLFTIGFGSSLVFNDIISITVTGLFASYFVPISLLFWRRVTGAIGAAAVHDDKDIINHPSSKLVWGPFRIPGFIGAANNALAMAYLILVFIFAFWPPAQPVTPALMNYASVVFAAVTIFSVVWYAVYARKFYKGPVIEIEPVGR